MTTHRVATPEEWSTLITRIEARNPRIAALIARTGASVEGFVESGVTIHPPLGYRVDDPPLVRKLTIDSPDGPQSLPVVEVESLPAGKN